MADVGFGATRSDLIVVRQIYIEHELFCYGAKGGRFSKHFAVAWVCAVDGTNFEARGIKGEDLLAETAMILDGGPACFKAVYFTDQKSQSFDIVNTSRSGG